MEKDLQKTVLGDCVMCRNKERVRLETAIANGMPKKYIAAQLKCSLEEVNYHMERHFAKAPEPKQLITYKAVDMEKFSKHDMLLEKLLHLSQRLDQYFEADRPDVSMTKQINDMHAELRKSVETLARLEGELKNEVSITIEHYSVLKATILSGLCPNCRDNLLKSLKEEERNASKPIIIAPEA